MTDTEQDELWNAMTELGKKFESNFLDNHQANQEPMPVSANAAIELEFRSHCIQIGFGQTCFKMAAEEMKDFLNRATCHSTCSISAETIAEESNVFFNLFKTAQTKLAGALYQAVERFSAFFKATHNLHPQFASKATELQNLGATFAKIFQIQTQLWEHFGNLEQKRNNLDTEFATALSTCDQLLQEISTLGEKFNAIANMPATNETDQFPIVSEAFSTQLNLMALILSMIYNGPVAFGQLSTES